MKKESEFSQYFDDDFEVTYDEYMTDTDIAPRSRRTSGYRRPDPDTESWDMPDATEDYDDEDTLPGSVKQKKASKKRRSPRRPSCSADPERRTDALAPCFCTGAESDRHPDPGCYGLCHVDVLAGQHALRRYPGSAGDNETVPHPPRLHVRGAPLPAL